MSPNYKKSRRRSLGICTYCQEQPAETRDHVVPRALFVPPFPNNLITVPACYSCNQIKGKDDDYLRDYLAMDFAGSTSPIADTLLRSKIKRSIAGNHSELFRVIAPQIRSKPLYTKAGIYLGDFAQAPIDDVRVVRAVGTILRGMFFHYSSGQLVPPHYRVELSRIMPWDMEMAWTTFKHFNLNRCAPVGDVWAGACARVQEDTLSSLWLTSFYLRVHFLASVSRPDFEELVGVNRRTG